MQLVSSLYVSLGHLQRVNVLLGGEEPYRIARKFIVNSVGHAWQQPKQAEDEAEDEVEDETKWLMKRKRRTQANRCPCRAYQNSNRRRSRRSAERKAVAANRCI